MCDRKVAGKQKKRARLDEQESYIVFSIKWQETEAQNRDRKTVWDSLCSLLNVLHPYTPWPSPSNQGSTIHVQEHKCKNKISWLFHKTDIRLYFCYLYMSTGVYLGKKKQKQNNCKFMTPSLNTLCVHRHPEMFWFKINVKNQGIHNSQPSVTYKFSHIWSNTAHSSFTLKWDSVVFLPTVGKEWLKHIIITLINVSR